jgi:hypothetical protein
MFTFCSTQNTQSYIHTILFIIKTSMWGNVARFTLQYNKKKHWPLLKTKWSLCMFLLHNMTYFSKNLDPVLELVLTLKYKFYNPTLSLECSASLIKGRSWDVIFNSAKLKVYTAAQPLVYLVFNFRQEFY